MSANTLPVPPHRPHRHPRAPSPGPSRASSFTSASDADRPLEEESNNSADESDFLDPDIVEDDQATAREESIQSPALALATPKPQIAPWPFQAEGQLSPVLAQPLSSFALGPPPVIPASSLPHEILLHILRMLPTTSLAPALLVCKAWCQCGVELLWHKPAFATMPALRNALDVLADPEQTFPYAQFIRRLNFSALRNDMADADLDRLRTCVRLERLTLAGCNALSAPGIIGLLRNCPRLVALDLSDVGMVDDEVVRTVADNCPRLQGLNLSGCKLVTDGAVEAIARGCPGLRRIKMRNVVELTSGPVILLSQSCTLLLEVDLVGCVKVRSNALQQLLRSSHHLRELSVSACTEIADDAFPPSQAPPVPNLWSRPPAEDDWNETVALSDGALIPAPKLLGMAPGLRTFDHLRYLDLTSCHHLTDEAVKGIVRHMPRIRNLILAKCHRLTNEAILAVSTLGKHLHYLHLGHLALIEDAAVIVLARSCTRLRYIDLANCNNLTDVSVFELAANLPRLKRIGLVRVFQVTDQAIYSLHARTSLERIHLSYCDHLTVKAVYDMLVALPRLTHLSLTGVRSFRRKDLQKWCRAPPPDFNSHQRDSFCVYSGRGVHELKRYLRSLNGSFEPWENWEEQVRLTAQQQQQRDAQRAALQQQLALGQPIPIQQIRPPATGPPAVPFPPAPTGQTGNGLALHAPPPTNASLPAAPPPRNVRATDARWPGIAPPDPQVAAAAAAAARAAHAYQNRPFAVQPIPPFRAAEGAAAQAGGSNGDGAGEVASASASVGVVRRPRGATVTRGNYDRSGGGGEMDEDGDSGEGEESDIEMS